MRIVFGDADEMVEPDLGKACDVALYQPSGTMALRGRFSM
jgi:hypothetical protein